MLQSKKLILGPDGRGNTSRKHKFLANLLIGLSVKLSFLIGVILVFTVSQSCR